MHQRSGTFLKKENRYHKDSGPQTSEQAEARQEVRALDKTSIPFKTSKVKR